ncbi:MAG: substrate-binding domain-containing protein [Treponema sp.]|jgi:ribose transport system substrate-binding protein|nr:substrate-binding domain-containing protein [Treponema sp.]
MKKMVLVLVALLAVLSFAACGGGSSQGGGAAVNTGSSSPLVGSASEEYYMVSFLSGIDYWKTCFNGMEDAAKLYGVTAQYTGQIDADVAGEVAVLEQVIAKQPKGITITCVNSTALADTINSAIRQGIAVITFDSDSPTSNRASYLSTGNEAAGEAAAAFLVQLIGNRGKIAILYTVGAENSESRVTGFKSWCAANAPGISFVDVNDAGDTTVATDNMSAAIQANGDLTALFCVDGIAGMSGPVAVQESGKSNIKVLAFDVDPTVLDKIKSGDIAATVAQGQYNMGYWSMNFLYHLAHKLPGADLPGFLDTGVTIVTRDTVDNYYVK